MIDKTMNCTAVERYDFAGRIYGDYMTDFEQWIGDEIAHFNRKNISNNGLNIKKRQFSYENVIEYNESYLCWHKYPKVCAPVLLCLSGNFQTLSITHQDRYNC